MNRPQSSEDADIVRCTARIVMGYVAGHRLPPTALLTLIMTVSQALTSEPDIVIAPAAPELAYVASDHPREQAPARRLSRKEIADSIQETYLVCFEDGMHYRMLSRHLRLYGLTPHAYRVKWGLPADYPMMPAADLQHRDVLARQRQLGKYDRSTAKPRKTYVFNANAKVQGEEAPHKPKAYSTDLTRGGWRRPGETGQAASPG